MDKFTYSCDRSLNSVLQETAVYIKQKLTFLSDKSDIRSNAPLSGLFVPAAYTYIVVVKKKDTSTNRKKGFVTRLLFVVG